jgi:hypothetical protein
MGLWFKSWIALGLGFEVWIGLTFCELFFFLKSKVKVALWKVWKLISFVNQTFEHYKTYQCYHFKSDDCESWEEINILFSLRHWMIFEVEWKDTYRGNF